MYNICEYNTFLEEYHGERERGVGEVDIYIFFFSKNPPNLCRFFPNGFQQKSPASVYVGETREGTGAKKTNRTRVHAALFASAGSRDRLKWDPYRKPRRAANDSVVASREKFTI